MIYRSRAFFGRVEPCVGLAAKVCEPCGRGTEAEPIRYRRSLRSLLPFRILSNRQLNIGAQHRLRRSSLFGSPTPRVLASLDASSRE